MFRSEHIKFFWHVLCSINAVRYGKFLFLTRLPSMVMKA